jgi:dephospho-CoA kinase
MLTVGLSGGICSGKSVVAAVLEQRGCRIFNADLIARRLLGPGTLLLREVRGLFATEIVGDDGALDRRLLGRLVFNDPEKLRLLNALVHPAVIAEEDRLLRDLEQEAAGAPCIAVVESALMAEAQTYRRYHRLVVVHCTVPQQIQRLVAGRGLSLAEAEARVRSQLPAGDKLALAHYTVDGSGSLEETRQRAGELYLGLARDEHERREGH